VFPAPPDRGGIFLDYYSFIPTQQVLMDTQNVFEEIEALRKLLEYHADLYYNLDRPEIEDSEYDALVRRLEILETENPKTTDDASITRRIGGSVGTQFTKVAHLIKMESLQNAFSENEIAAFIERVKKTNADPLFIVEPKIDGLSVSLEYTDGLLTVGSTRGDGSVGEDVTANLKTVKSIPHGIPGDIERLIVRGEVFMPKQAYLSIVRQQQEDGEFSFKNPRNAAAGSLRQKDPAVTASRELDVFIFNVQYSSFPFTGHKESLDYLKGMGFPVSPSYRQCSSLEEVCEEIERIQKDRQSFPFDIDGAVVKLDSLQGRIQLGSTSKFPRWAIAYKYPPEIKTSVLRGVEVQVGRTGVLTPTAVVEPVLIAGSTVSRASLHNEDFINQLDVRIGDTVDIHKAGDIIPEILKSYNHLPLSSTYKMPLVCPSCGKSVVRLKDEAAIRCVNPECPEQLRRNIIHFASRDAMDIEGLGPATIDQLIKNEYLRTGAAALYELRQDDLLKLDKIKEKSSSNILKALEISKNRNLDRLIYALGIRNVGQRAAMLLAKRFGTLEALASAKTDEISAVDGVGPIIAESVTRFFENPGSRELLQKLIGCGVNTRYVSTDSSIVFEGMTFVVTGTLSEMTRDEVNKYIVENGGKTSSSVTKKTSYVVSGENPGSKLRKAVELGIPVIGELQLKKLAKTGDIS